MRVRLLLAVSFLHGTPALAEGAVRMDAAVGFHRFEQQVKSEIGGARGERLVEEGELGVAVLGTWQLADAVAVGLYSQFDRGSRNAGRFKGLDAENKTIVKDEVGGDFTEFWLGPVLRLQSGPVFGELAYVPLGIRNDDARTDLHTADGDNTTALRTSPTVSYYSAIGLAVPIRDRLQATVRLEYRVRYYDRRGADPLADEVVHGTQNAAPFVGVAWTP